jgi:protein TonB
MNAPPIGAPPVGSGAPEASPLAPAPDLSALAVRPTDFGTWPGALASEAAAGKAKALTVAVLAHVLIGAGVLGWRESGGFAAPGEDEIPVEIVVEAGVAQPQPPASQQPPAETLQAVSPEPVPPTEAKDENQPATAAEPETRSEQRTIVAVAPAPAADADAALSAQQKALAEAQAQRRAGDAARRRREEQARERRIERDKKAHALHAEHEAVARERRAEARRAAEADQRQSAAQERRRVASLAPSQGAGLTRGDAFDAAAYRQVVARAVSAAVARACPHGGGGRVVVALTIGGAGQIAAASLSSSSGDGALDSAAVSAVRRAGPFPAPAGRSSVSVPVGVTCK